MPALENNRRYQNIGNGSPTRCTVSNETSATCTLGLLAVRHS